MRIGKFTIGTIDDWTPTSGALTSWHPTDATRQAAEKAPVSPAPVSYMQAQHIRGIYNRTSRGLDFSRQVVAACEVPGKCDTAAMNQALNAYLRQHDTFRSWFEYDGTGDPVRHTIGDVADIEFEPVEHGEMAVEDVRKHVVNIPTPMQWGCFTFGIIQGEDSFTFYASVDHVHGDAALIGITMLQAHAGYTALAAGGGEFELPDAGSFDEFCVAEREFTSTLTVDTPEVQTWIEFADNNRGSLPEFPLPLGNADEATASVMTGGEMLMDPEQTARFEAVCAAAGARFVGGLFASIAMVEHELTGAATYYGLTPRDNRRTSDNFMTQGWFTGLVPITVPIAAASLGEAAWAAQESFDSSLSMARVPYDRAVELASWLSEPAPNYPVVNFLQGDAVPLNVVLVATEMGVANNVGIYGDGRYSYQLNIYIFKYAGGTLAEIMYPDNSVAAKSVPRYLAALKSVCARVADGGQW